MQPPTKIPLSQFPPDLVSLMVLPAVLICHVAASYLPGAWRAVLFSLVGVALVVLSVRLALSGRFLNWVVAGIYLLIGIGMFYIAYMDATLFA